MSALPWLAVFSLPLLGWSVRLWGRWAISRTWWRLLLAFAVECTGLFGVGQLWQLAHETPYPWAPYAMAAMATIVIALAVRSAWRALAPPRFDFFQQARALEKPDV
jgi:hypothetical protein